MYWGQSKGQGSWTIIVSCFVILAVSSILNIALVDFTTAKGIGITITSCLIVKLVQIQATFS